MGDEFTPEQEMERLRSMHQTVEKLRSQLRDIELDWYSVSQNLRRKPWSETSYDGDAPSNKYT